MACIVTYGNIWQINTPCSPKHADGHNFEKANKATLPFLSFVGLSFGVRFIWSPAMEANSLSFVWRASKVNSFNSVVEEKKDESIKIY